MTRLSHNRRKKSFDKLKMLNINEELKDIKALENHKKDKPLTKTAITNKIAKLNYLLKQYEKQRANLYGVKLEKKEKQILKLQNDIALLKTQRENTQSQMHYAKKAYVEFVLTITKAPQVYKKDIAFANELKRVSMKFLKEKFTADICNIDIHLDQSTPHLHVMSRYIGNNSLQKDLDKNYSKKRFQYSDMQIEFNQFVKDNFDFNKFDKLKIEDITKGGKREYLPLTEYKELNRKITQKVQKEINAILDKTKVITKLIGENHIKESDYKTLLKKYRVVKKQLYFLHHLTNKNEVRKNLDTLTKENKKLHQELENIKKLNAKSKHYEQAIKDIFGEEIVNLSSVDFTIKIEDKKSNIIILAKQNRQLKGKLTESQEALNKVQTNDKKQKHLINTLQQEITLKDSYIEKMKKLILSSKIPSVIKTFKSIGDSFEPFKAKYLKIVERNLER